MLECQILTAESGIEAIVAEWRQLYASLGRSPFASYDVFSIWWDMIGKTESGRMPHVVAGYRNGKLAAVLPLTVLRRHGLRILQAAGYKAYNYCDILAEDTEHAAQLWQAARQSPHYDFADIRDVYPETLCHEVLTAFARKRDLSDAYFLDFKWPSGKDWLASLPSATRRDISRCKRRLEEKGTLRYEVYKKGPLPTAIIENIVKQKVAWAFRHQKQGLFYHPNVPEYFQKILASVAQQGELFLAWLICGDDVIACNQGFIHQGIVHMSFWTYDPAFARFSPGNVILSNSIGWAIDNGLHGIDFRQGRNQLKRKYANKTNHCAEFTFAGSARGRMIENLYVCGRSLLRIMERNTSRLAQEE